eukprot:scpid49404/ scgid35521/ 
MGTWTALVPAIMFMTTIFTTSSSSAVAVNCSVPAIANGTRDRTEVQYAHTATYSCNGGLMVVGDATPTCAADGNLTSVPFCDTLSFLSLMSGSAGSAGLVRLDWSTGIPNTTRLYYRITFGKHRPLSTATTYQLSLLEQTPTGPVSISNKLFTYNPAIHTETRGFFSFADSNVLNLLQMGHAILQVNHVSKSDASSIMAGDILRDPHISNVSSAYSDEMLAVASGGGSPYVCAARSGFDDATQRHTVVLQCSPNATFSNATITFTGPMGQVMEVTSLNETNAVAPSTYAVRFVYPGNSTFVNAFVGTTTISITLGSGIITGDFIIPEKHLHADLTGITAGNQLAASAGYAIIDTNKNKVSLNIFLAGLRSDITKATLYSKDGTYENDVTSCFDDAICITSFDWPTFGSAHQLTDSYLYVNISTKMFPDGALRGQFAQRALAMSIFDANPIELVAALSEQQANPSNPIAVGTGGSASFWILPPERAYAHVNASSYQVLSRISVRSLSQVQPADLVKEVIVYGPAVDGARRLLLTFSLLNRNTGLQMFNLSMADAMALMSANITISSFRVSPIIGGLLYTRPKVLDSFINGDQARSMKTTAAGIGTILIDRFGTFHFAILMAGFTKNVRSVKAFTRNSTTNPTVSAQVADFFADFEGPEQAHGKWWPDVAWLLNALNDRYEISASTELLGTPADITGALSPSVGGGFGFYHFDGLMLPTTPAEYMGFSYVYMSSNNSITLSTIIVGDNGKAHTVRVVDSSSIIYFKVNNTAVNSSILSESITDWNSTVK